MKTYFGKIILLMLISLSIISCKDNVREDDEIDLIEDDIEIEEVGFDDNLGFNEFDANNDDFWDINEFNEANNDWFDEWDLDDDGAFNDEEFYATTMGNTDINNDRRISQEEWNEGQRNMFGNYAEENDFDAWDVNDDNFIDDNEWNTGFGESNWFSTYDGDADGTITDVEWNEGFFNEWDLNDDGMLDENEYNSYYTYTGEEM